MPGVYLLQLHVETAPWGKVPSRLRTMGRRIASRIPVGHSLNGGRGTCIDRESRLFRKKFADRV